MEQSGGGSGTRRLGGKKSNPLLVGLKDLPGRNIFKPALCDCILLVRKVRNTGQVFL